MDMRYYETYPGGKISGELIVEADPERADNLGVIIISKDDYSRSYRADVERLMRKLDTYHQGCDVTSMYGMVAIHPSCRVGSPMYEHVERRLLDVAFEAAAAPHAA